MSEKDINLVNEDKSSCCGCGLCAVICPVQAIKMKEDNLGYVYPCIEQEKCINCRKCVNTCIMNKSHEYSSPIDAYAGIRNNRIKLQNSSSGGTFAAVAEHVLDQGGVVAGARIEDDFSISHCLVTEGNDLDMLLGSKYVQSDITGVYESLEVCLNKGVKVLFCGTPCQVDAVKTYTGNPLNLITMEVVCHGVPNQKMFKSFIDFVGGSKKVVTFQFRDKSQGWSFNHKAVFSDGTVKKINHRLSSYMTLFMKGCIYRESCYKCPYAQNNRNSDITIGDFWGVVRKRPDLAKQIDIDEGVSCVIVNSEKGNQVLLESDITLYHVEYSDIIEGNGPLNHPSSKGKKIKEVLKIWGENGSWSDVEKYWKHRYYKLRFKLWAMLPNCIRNQIRIILKVR